jgi:hypothetical protein
METAMTIHQNQSDKELIGMKNSYSGQQFINLAMFENPAGELQILDNHFMQADCNSTDQGEMTTKFRDRKEDKSLEF